MHACVEGGGAAVVGLAGGAWGGGGGLCCTAPGMAPSPEFEPRGKGSSSSITNSPVATRDFALAASFTQLNLQSTNVRPISTNVGVDVLLSVRATVCGCNVTGASWVGGWVGGAGEGDCVASIGSSLSLSQWERVLPLLSQAPLLLLDSLLLQPHSPS